MSSYIQLHLPPRLTDLPKHQQDIILPQAKLASYEQAWLNTGLGSEILAKLLGNIRVIGTEEWNIAIQNIATSTQNIKEQGELFDLHDGEDHSGIRVLNAVTKIYPHKAEVLNLGRMPRRTYSSRSTNIALWFDDAAIGAGNLKRDIEASRLFFQGENPRFIAMLIASTEVARARMLELGVELGANYYHIPMLTDVLSPEEIGSLQAVFPRAGFGDLSKDILTMFYGKEHTRAQDNLLSFFTNWPFIAIEADDPEYALEWDRNENPLKGEYLFDLRPGGQFYPYGKEMF